MTMEASQEAAEKGAGAQALDCPLEDTTSMCPLQQLQAEGTAGFRKQGMDFLRWRGAGMADPQGQINS